MHGLQPALRERAQMPHAIRILIIEGFVHAAVRLRHRQVIHAEVTNVELIQAHIAQALQRG
jgi:hypothetical protein